MQYIYLIIILLFFIGAILGYFNYIQCLKRDFLRRMIEKTLLQHRDTHFCHTAYTSEVVLAAAKWGCKLSNTKFKKFTNLLHLLQISPIIVFLNNNEQKNLAKQIKASAGLLKKEISFVNKKNILASTLIAEAKDCLSDGDLLSASEKTSQAAKIYNKLKFVYEEADAYLLLGTIYRVCAVYDVADFMLKTATKIFGYIGAKSKEAECLGNLGMLMTAQNRFDEAYNFLQNAEDIYKKIPQQIGIAEISNQRALTFLVENKFAEAKKAATTALKIHRQKNNSHGQAFSYEIYAYIYKANQKWQQVKNMTQKAATIYKNKKNYSAYLGMLFLQADVLFTQNKYQEAEKILRQIININKQHKSCFQIANTYSLLGLIYLRMKDFRRAKGLFKQSLDYENQTNRTLGKIIDYANIANIESKCNNKSQATKYLELAIYYARELEENELLKILEQRLTQIQSTTI